MRKQYNCVDAIKLIMSLFVIAIHADLFDGLMAPTIRLAVPVFFIFTGFFSFTKINAAPDSDKRNVLWNIEKRYFQLYLFWFIVFLPITIYYREYYTYDFFDSIKTFLKDLFFGSTFRASWYLMACILGTAIVYWLSRINQALLIILGVVCYLLATYASKYQIIILNNDILNALYTTINRCIGRPYNNVFISIMYLTIGKMIADHRFIFFNKTRSILGFIICYLGLLYEFCSSQPLFWFQYNCDCWFMLAPTATFFVLFILALDIKLPHTHVMRSMSTIIYCSHLTIMMVVKKVFLILNIAYTPIIVFVATLMCTVALSFIIFKLERTRNFKILKFSH